MILSVSSTPCYFYDIFYCAFRSPPQMYVYSTINHTHKLLVSVSLATNFGPMIQQHHQAAAEKQVKYKSCVSLGWRSHSFSSLSYDRSKASSKANSPHSGIWSFLLQMTVSSPFLKVIQQLPTSSSTSSCHFYPPLYLSFSNPLQKAVSTQNVTNPVRLPFTYFMQDIPLLLDSKQYIFISHMISPTDLFHPSPAPHFKTIQVFLIYCPKRPII